MLLEMVEIVVDTIFDGLELYVTSTDDYEFALQIIQQIPKKIINKHRYYWRYRKT